MGFNLKGVLRNMILITARKNDYQFSHLFAIRYQTFNLKDILNFNLLVSANISHAKFSNFFTSS